MAGLVNIFKNVQKSEIIEEVKSEVTFSYQYFSLLILSVVIATFGLLLGNTAIIIGAMILSPMIWPIIGLSVGTVTSKKNLTVSSAILLTISIVVTVLVSYGISVISPIVEVNTEIALRINPTFFDLIIALAAGTAAILIIAWPKYSNALAGVAVAASVLPPICVTGIGLALGDTGVAYGSFILFLTNMASIIFVGIGIFALFRFYRKSDENQVKKVELGLMLSFIVVLLLSFQLIFSLSQILYEENAEVAIESTLTEELHHISSDITVDSVNASSLSRSNDLIDIVSTVRVPSDVQITVTQKNEIVEKIAETLGKEINLELRIVPVLKVVAQDESEQDNGVKPSVKSAQEIISEYMKSVSEEIIVESVAVNLRKGDGLEKYGVDVHISVPPDIQIEPEMKEEIVFDLVNKLQKPVVLDIRVSRFERI